jgi:hypothetical protein
VNHFKPFYSHTHSLSSIFSLEVVDFIWFILFQFRRAIFQKESMKNIDEWFVPQWWFISLWTRIGPLNKFFDLHFLLLFWTHLVFLLLVQIDRTLLVLALVLFIPDFFVSILIVFLCLTLGIGLVCESSFDYSIHAFFGV